MASTASNVGALVPNHIVIGLEPNFFVTEARVRCLDGDLSGRILYCSLPLCSVLDDQEFGAVLTHELAHFVGEDTQFSTRFYPIYRGTIGALVSMQQHAQGWRALAIWPVVHLLGFFLTQFTFSEREISRERELSADTFAARYYGANTMATALYKVVNYSPLFDQAITNAIAALEDTDGEIKITETVTSAFATLATGHRSALSPAHTNLSESLPVHPTDSHPPVSIRLNALGFSDSNLPLSAFLLPNNSSSLSLFSELAELDKTLTLVLFAVLKRNYEHSES